MQCNIKSYVLHREPLDSAYESGTNLLSGGATVLANNVVKLVLTEEYY